VALKSLREKGGLKGKIQRIGEGHPFIVNRYWITERLAKKLDFLQI
jgi:hypothetical protein